MAMMLHYVLHAQQRKDLENKNLNLPNNSYFAAFTSIKSSLKLPVVHWSVVYLNQQTSAAHLVWRAALVWLLNYTLWHYVFCPIVDCPTI